MADSDTTQLSELRQAWDDAWPSALATWSRFVQLTPPRWCMTTAEEQREELTGSFAMIRLVDHTVVVSLRQVREMKLDRFAKEVLAHEIGHHVYCPADLNDSARLLARIRAGLPTREKHAPMIANLYTDLLINDRLQRACGLDMAGVYLALETGSSSGLWTLYMRIYEILWNRPREELAKGEIDKRLNHDAGLGARLIRSYARDWLEGSGRFACLCLPYLLRETTESPGDMPIAWHDTRDAGKGGAPDGLVEIEASEISGAIHPAEDPALSGLDPAKKEEGEQSKSEERARVTGVKSTKRIREPFDYKDVLRASGVMLSDAEIIARYYRELAQPHLVPFPARESVRGVDPIPEGLDLWDIDAPLEEIDWLGTLMASPVVIPGITTRLRRTDDSPGQNPEREPIDLYLGIDCSGSMGDPSAGLSYPVLAGAVIALSALRTGSRVMAVLSGEPGKTIGTEGFVRDERSVLGILTSYLGTGMTFGVHRLADTFTKDDPGARPVHILIVTDNDLFYMLDQANTHGKGWDVAEKSLKRARGGGTVVLQLPEYLMNMPGAQQTVSAGDARLQQQGWDVARVDSLENLLAFARRFTQRSYGAPKIRP